MLVSILKDFKIYLKKKFSQEIKNPKNQNSEVAVFS